MLLRVIISISNKNKQTAIIECRSLKFAAKNRIIINSKIKKPTNFGKEDAKPVRPKKSTILSNISLLFANLKCYQCLPILVHQPQQQTVFFHI